MNTEQTAIFFLGLQEIETSYPKLGRFQELSKYVTIAEDPVTKTIILRLLSGIEKHSELWRKIEILFEEINGIGA